MNIPFDIETVPTQNAELAAQIAQQCLADRDDALAAVKAPSNYKDADKISAYITSEREKILANFESDVKTKIEKTSLDGGLGQIVCIGWAVDDGDTRCLQVVDLSAKSEAAMLEVWFDDLNKLHGGNPSTRPLLIGHNHVGFDIPFVWKRAVVHGIKPPFWFPRNPKPWADSVFDTMTQWAGDRERIKMDALCRILGIPGKGDISGADVWPMVQAGRLDEVSEYCRADVERTRAIYKRMTFADAA